MSSAAVRKQLKIKASTLKRVHKELSYYEKERDREQKRVDQLKADNADPHDLKQAESVLEESAMMVPETRTRLEAALADLQQFMSDNSSDVAGSEELEFAEEVLAAANEGQ